MKKLIVLLSLLVTFGQAFATENDMMLTVVRGNGNYPPYEMAVSENEVIVSDSEVTGIHIDLVSAIAKQLKLKIKILSVPWKRAIHMMKSGNADAILFIGKNEEREEWAWFIDGNVLSKTQNGFFELKPKKRKFLYNGNLKQLEGLTIGTILGYSYGREFDRTTYFKKDDGAKDESALLRKLVYQRFDLGFADINVIQYLTKKQDYAGKIEILEPSRPGYSAYIAFSKTRKRKELAKRFAEALVPFKKTQDYDNILNKYGIK